MNAAERRRAARLSAETVTIVCNKMRLNVRKKGYMRYIRKGALADELGVGILFWRPASWIWGYGKYTKSHRRVLKVIFKDQCENLQRNHNRKDEPMNFYTLHYIGIPHLHYTIYSFVLVTVNYI